MESKQKNWTDVEYKIFDKIYSYTSNKDLTDIFNTTIGSIKSLAARRNLKKSYYNNGEVVIRENSEPNKPKAEKKTNKTTINTAFDDKLKFINSLDPKNNFKRIHPAYDKYGYYELIKMFKEAGLWMTKKRD